MRCSILIQTALLVSVFAGTLSAQVPVELHKRAYKQKDREIISRVIDGKEDAVLEGLQKYLAQAPRDEEALFCLAMIAARAGRTEAAVEAARLAIEAGMPVERFLAGPRELLEPLVASEAFAPLVPDDIQLLHGPMLGCMTDDSAKFWVRTAEEVPVQVLVGTSASLDDPIRSATTSTEAALDYTTIASVERLDPDTTYHYNVLIDGQPSLEGELPTFRTFPREDQPARFTVAFGGGAGYTPWKEHVWDVVGKQEITALLLLGDNVYIDTPTKPAVQRYCYYRRQSRPEFRRLTGRVPVFAIWDDHDFGTNDCFVTAKIDEPAWKIPVWNVFRQNWNNPSYGDGEKAPGCWFRFRIADVDFFMLDGRYYRTNPREPSPSMLGAKQKAWLKKELDRSDATFKVIAGPVPWVLEAKGNSLDTWRGFQAERDELFAYLAAERIDGVILLSADRHRSDYWRIDRPDAYPLYEFESSRLTNVHVHPVMPGSLFGYNSKCSFGKVTFDTTQGDPELTYEIINIDGEKIHAFSVHKSEISHR